MKLNKLWIFAMVFFVAIFSVSAADSQERKKCLKKYALVRKGCIGVAKKIQKKAYNRCLRLYKNNDIAYGNCTGTADGIFKVEEDKCIATYNENIKKCPVE